MGAGASSPSTAETKRGGQYRVPEGDWFYAEADTRIGPCTADRLHALHADGTVPHHALVWCPRLTQWTPYRDALPVLMREIDPASAAETADSVHPPAPATDAGAAEKAAAEKAAAEKAAAEAAAAEKARRLLSGPRVGAIQGLPSASATPSHAETPLATPPAAGRSPTKRGFGWSSRKSFPASPASPASPATAHSSSTPSVQADTGAASQPASDSPAKGRHKAEPLGGSPLKRGAGLQPRRVDPLKPPPGGGAAARFVALSELKAHGKLPRLGSKPKYKHRLTGEGNANLCRHRADFPAHTAFVFVSHMWARPSGAADTAHPDDEGNGKHALIVAALEALRGGVRGKGGVDSGSEHAPLPRDVEVAVWIDWCCLDQDAPPSRHNDDWTRNERRQMGKLIASCDLVLTPVLDDAPDAWEYPAVWSSLLSQYRAEAWQEYWARGWCGLEALCAAAHPVADAPGRAALLRGALASALLLGRRRHAIFGTKELRGGLPPLFLPPFLDATLAEWAPEEGALSREADREVVRYLVEEARRHLVEETPGWVGEYQGAGRGFGKFVNEDGSWMEGDFLNGQIVGIGKYVDPSGEAYTGEFKDPLLRGRRNGFGKQVYRGGDLYEGQFVNDEREGEGRCAFAMGAVYTGQWQQGKRHGEGREVNPANDRYEGQWERGRMHGNGKLEYGSGAVYVGTWQDDKRHGQGRHTYANGESYYGGWRDDRKHGRGKFVYASGAVYEGEWAADKRHGRGKFIHADGDKFEGDFVEDEQHGEGRYLEASTGDAFEGRYVRGEREGQGRLQRADGGIYEGQYRAGLAEGRGKFTAANGDVYEGDFRAGHRTGAGRMTFADGKDVYEGEWLAGKMHGRGRRVFRDGTIYDGAWKEGAQHGRGLELFPSGSVYEGEFERGQKHGRGRRRMVAAIAHMGQQGSSTHEIAALFVDAEVRCALLGLIATGTLVHEGDWKHNMERTPFKIEDEFYDALHAELGLGAAELADIGRHGQQEHPG